MGKWDKEEGVVVVVVVVVITIGTFICGGSMDRVDQGGSEWWTGMD